MAMLTTTLTKRAQTVVPAAIREHSLGIGWPG